MSTNKTLLAFKRLKRATRLSILIGGVVLLFGGALIVGGEMLLDEWRLRADRLNAEIRSVDAEIRTLRDDIQYVADNTTAYEAALARGMFAERNRLAAQDSVKTLLLGNRLEGSISFQPQVRQGPVTVGGQPYDVLREPVEVLATGVLDADMLQFARDVAGVVPGFLVFQDARLERRALTPEGLTRLSNGIPEPLVGARLLFQWRSAAPSAAGGQG
ncbi:hypothetical protein [Caenispirillum bisanense]|uniref:Uncharacterized protein n=1 Tax=Caenispirillum bisanense TaxID=414052 RepID=A0A286GX07_9PROT|nr:hypothetical protein [Caenispirillum bisanense]SOE00022.1 hypothetical protein SAMN05421508_11142 [Caenispirillum bisanense]